MVAFRMASTTIIIPCYNEATRLDIQAFVQYSLRDLPHRFLLVNDGSTDTTIDMLRDLESYDAKHFEVLDLEKNGGKAEAVRQGILAALAAEPEYVGFWDADLATSLDEIERFQDVLDSRNDLEAVFGSRVPMLGHKIRRDRRRQWLGRIFATAASQVLRVEVRDTQCGAKLFRAGPMTAEIFSRPLETNWIFDVELMARMIQYRQAAGLSPIEDVLYELPLEHWRDVAGSKVRPRDFFKAGSELWAIRRMLKKPAFVPAQKELVVGNQQSRDADSVPPVAETPQNEALATR